MPAFCSNVVVEPLAMVRQREHAQRLQPPARPPDRGRTQRVALPRSRSSRGLPCSVADGAPHRPRTARRSAQERSTQQQHVEPRQSGAPIEDRSAPIGRDRTRESAARLPSRHDTCHARSDSGLFLLIPIGAASLQELGRKSARWPRRRPARRPRILHDARRSHIMSPEPGP